MGLGSLVWTLPHFTTPAYVTSDQDKVTSSDQVKGLCGGGSADKDYEAEVLPDESQRSSSVQNYR